MSIKEIQNELKAFSEKHNLEQKAIDGCLEFIKNELNDDSDALGGMKIDEIRLGFIRQEFIFHDFLRPSPFLRTRIGLYKKDSEETSILDLESIGYYDLDTDVEGESVDDWLILDM